MPFVDAFTIGRSTKLQNIDFVQNSHTAIKKKNRVQPLKESQYWGVTPEYFECFNIGWCGAPLVSRQVGFLATNTTSASYCTLQLLKSSNSIGGGGELYPTR